MFVSCLLNRSIATLYAHMSLGTLPELYVVHGYYLYAQLRCNFIGT